jgi:hypothetical protein
MIGRLANVLARMPIFRQGRLFARRVADSWPYVPLPGYVHAGKLYRFWQLIPYAQQNYASLSSLYDLTKLVERNKIPGAFVECGVWRGGAAALMALIAKDARSGRKTWLFDSFEGQPEASTLDTGEAAKQLARGRLTGRLVSVGTNVASIDEVKALLFGKLGLAIEDVLIIKGWFQDTLPSSKDHIGPIALLRIDGDWYESTKVCLDNLYDNVSEGGYIIIDDYGWFPGCRAAVDEFLRARHLKPELRRIDYSRVFFRKTGPWAAPNPE